MEVAKKSFSQLYVERDVMKSRHQYRKSPLRQTNKLNRHFNNRHLFQKWLNFSIFETDYE